MYNIIEMIYHPYSVYYQVFTPVFVFIALVLVILSVIFIFKTKKIKFFIFAIIFAFIAYQWVPYYYTKKAVLTKDKAEILSNYNNAAKTAIFPAHKGFIYADAASYSVLNKDITSAIKYYDLAFKYLKNYKSVWAWGTAPLAYLLNEEYDKAAEIAAELHLYTFAVTACILKEDYNSALDFINTALLERPKDAWLYARRALIYKNLNEKELAKKDYEKALELCNCPNCIDRTKNSYNNYAVWDKNYWEQKRQDEYGLN